MGIAFQSFAGSDAENIGWVIPTAVLHHFLEDYQRNERFTGFPCVGLLWQKMESKALKRQMKMQARPFCVADGFSPINVWCFAGSL